MMRKVGLEWQKDVLPVGTQSGHMIELRTT